MMVKFLILFGVVVGITAVIIYVKEKVIESRKAQFK